MVPLGLTIQLTVLVTANDNAIRGNDSANILTGLGGNDTIISGDGTDTLIGGIGNDTYVDPNGLDIIIEKAGEGIDTIEIKDDLLI